MNSGFFTKVELDDRMVKQLSGSTLTLEGLTNFIGILKSKGVEIDATISGDPTNYIGRVLTFIGDNKIALSEYSGGDSIFDSKRDTTRDGLPIVNVSGETVNQFLEGYFFPKEQPDININISTENQREYGDNTVGNINWIAIKKSEPITNIDIDSNGDGLFNRVISVVDGNTQSGSTAYILDVNSYNPPQGSIYNEQEFKIKVRDGITEPSISSTKITWRHNKYWYGDTNFYDFNNSVELNNLISEFNNNAYKELSSSIEKTITISLNNEYFYFASPKQFGVPLFRIGGNLNNAWGNVDLNTLFETPYTNSNGYVEDYYICRSERKLTGKFNITITN